MCLASLVFELIKASENRVSRSPRIRPQVEKYRFFSFAASSLPIAIGWTSDDLTNFPPTAMMMRWLRGFLEFDQMSWKVDWTLHDKDFLHDATTRRLANWLVVGNFKTGAQWLLLPRWWWWEFKFLLPSRSRHFARAVRGRSVHYSKLRMQSSRLIKWNDLWLLMLNDLFSNVIARTKWILLSSLTVNIWLTATPHQYIKGVVNMDVVGANAFMVF